MIGSVKVSLARRARVSDNQGGWKEAWTEYAEESVRIRVLSARERLAAGQFRQDISHRLYLRGGSQIMAGDRVLARGKWFDVAAVTNPAMAGEYLTAECAEVVDGGV